MAHLFIVAVNDSFDRKNVNHFQIYYVLDFSFFMSQDDAYYHIHQNDPTAPALGPEVHRRHPVGPPGADLVDLLKRRELDSTSPRL